MPYTLRFHSQVKQQMRLVPERIAKDVAKVILDLADDPYPPNAEELRDQYTKTWKIKIDGWRIFYRVNEQDKIVTIIAVKQRNRDTYRRLS
jgi:addiction module RelE/StbE family toxin